MSDKEWYEGLTADELEGKHVLVTYDEGCVVSGRMVERYGDVVIADGSCDGVGVLYRGGDGLKLDRGVRDFRLVWDERDWERIPIEDISKADAVVVNGRLISVTGLFNTHRLLPIEGSSVPFEHVSCALRRRDKLPTEPGYYRSGDCSIWLLDAGKWYLLIGPYYIMPVLPEKVALPLTPVYFVDGRAE